jgi:hypothetical protein
VPQFTFGLKPIVSIVTVSAATLYIELVGAPGDVFVARFNSECLDPVRDFARRGRHGGSRAGNVMRRFPITYHRGHVSIVDREKLESASCECYRTATDLLRNVTRAQKSTKVLR